MSLLQPSLEWMHRTEMLLVLLVWLDSINCEARNSIEKEWKTRFQLSSNFSSILRLRSFLLQHIPSKGSPDRVSLVSHFYGTIKQTVIMTHSTKILNLLWKHQNPQITHQAILSISFRTFQFCYRRGRINSHRRTRRSCLLFQWHENRRNYRLLKWEIIEMKFDIFVYFFQHFLYDFNCHRGGVDVFSSDASALSKYLPSR